MPYTPNYNLEQPLGTDNYDVGVFNSNADIIDETLKAVEVTADAAAIIWHTSFMLNKDLWQGSGPYTQQVNVQGITAEMIPVADIVLSDDTPQMIKEENEYAKVSRYDTGNGTITVICAENKPEIDLTIQLLVNSNLKVVE